MSSIFPWQMQSWQFLTHRKNQNKLPHALLITGKEGVGKFIFAKKFANFVLCEQNPSDSIIPCGHCNACILCEANNHPDLIVVQPEEGGKAIKIDEIREVIADLGNTAHQGDMRVLIIEPADLLNTASSNALLKTLEEPPAGTIIILISAYPNVLPATIRSRCQLLSISTPDYKVSKVWLDEQISGRSDGALLLALTENAPLKALALTQGDFLIKREEFFKALSAYGRGEKRVGDLSRIGIDFGMDEFLLMWIYLVNDLIKIKFNARDRLVNQDQHESLSGFASKLSISKLFNYMEHLHNLRRVLFKKINLNEQMVIENVIIAWGELMEGYAV
jgi:DNA polymerase III subunit delta'